MGKNVKVSTYAVSEARIEETRLSNPRGAAV